MKCLAQNVNWKSRVPELNIGDANIAKELSYTRVITLYILFIATFIVLQSIFPQPTNTKVGLAPKCY